MQLTAAQHVMCIHIHTPALVTRTLYLHMRYIAFYVIYRSLPRRKLRSKRMLDCLLVNLVSFILCLTCIICFNACHVACSLLTSEQTSAALKFQEPFYCQNCLSKILPFQSVPDIKFAFSRLDHIYSCNSPNPNTYDVHNVHNPYFSTSDMNQMFTKATTSFSVFHLNIRSLAKNFYKLQDFVSMLNKAPSCIAVSETWLNSESAVGTIQLQNYTFVYKPSSTRAGGVGLYIQNCLNYSVCHDICMPSSNCESLWVKIKTNSSKFIYLGVIYRHPNQQFDDFEKDSNSLLTNFNLNNNE